MDETILRLGVALAIGLLVGLERGWRERDQPEGSRTAGLRTFGIFGLMGGLFAAVAGEMAAPVVFAAGFLGLAALYGLFQYRETQNDRTYSVTGLMAGMCVFALGGLAVAGDYQVAAAGGAALAAILASREVLHAALRRLTWAEVRSAMVLAVMTTIILPLLPNRAIDPWGGFNPWEVWFFTVLIAAISYVGYIAVRVLGPRRGLLVSGLAGALVSSTAVTVALARMARGGGRAVPLAGVAALAALVSVLRVLVVVLLLQPRVFVVIAPTALAAAAVLCFAGLLMLSRGAATREGADGVDNPFELKPLLVFAGFFALVSTASAALVGAYGSASLLGSSAVSAVFDVDVAVLSALRLLGQQLDVEIVGTAVLAALGANAFGRFMLGALAGPRAYALPLFAATATAAAAAGAVYALSFSA